MTNYHERAEALSRLREPLRRAAELAIDLAETARRNHNKTAALRAADLLESITDAHAALAHLMRQLTQELQPQTNERPNQ